MISSEQQDTQDTAANSSRCRFGPCLARTRIRMAKVGVSTPEASKEASDYAVDCIAPNWTGQNHWSTGQPPRQSDMHLSRACAPTRFFLASPGCLGFPRDHAAFGRHLAQRRLSGEGFAGFMDVSASYDFSFLCLGSPGVLAPRARAFQKRQDGDIRTRYARTARPDFLPTRSRQ